MSPMNFDQNRFIDVIVKEYEEKQQQGTAIFFEEKTFLKLIQHFEKQDQLSKALKVVAEAITIHPYSSDLYLKKAQLLIDSGQEDEALLTLDDAMVFSPGEKELKLLKAEALIALDLHQEGLLLLQELKNEVLDTRMLSDIYVIEAQIYENQECFERMFYALKAALEEDYSNVAALERIWLCVELSRKYEESITLHEWILDQDAYIHLAWYNLGHANAYKGNYAEAIEAYEFALLIKEDFEFAYRDCAELCFELKLFNKALKYYQEIMERFNPDSDIFLRVGQCYEYMNSFTIARTFYFRALKLDPLNDEVFFHIGKCFLAEKKWESAVRSLEKAVRIEDKQEDYYAELGNAYMEVGEINRAEKCYKNAIKIAPECYQYWTQYALFLVALDREEEALSLLEKAEEYTASIDLLYCRVACLFSIGKRKEAIYWFGEALIEDFDAHVILFKWLPDLEEDSDILNLISAYMA